MMSWHKVSSERTLSWIGSGTATLAVTYRKLQRGREGDELSVRYWYISFYRVRNIFTCIDTCTA